MPIQREEGPAGKEGGGQSSETIALTLFGRLIHFQECTPSSGHVGRKGPTMQTVEFRSETSPPDGLRWTDLEGHPEALDAALRGDWSGVGLDTDEERDAA
jgi:hypothetical protein